MDADLELAMVDRLARDILRGSALTTDQARYFVDMYYTLQKDRMRAANHSRSGAETTEVANWLFGQMRVLEGEIQKLLGAWAAESVPGQWLQSVMGIGPVLSAGFLAHIDIERAPTVGHIWRFAGLDPTVSWSKGQKRPWNARLKLVCWKAGDSFVKLSNRDDAVYGRLYRERKAREVERNEAGLFAEQAAQALESRDIKDEATKITYLAGKLPAGRLDLRARRYAVKLFLAHLHHVLFECRYQHPPPFPYVLSFDPRHTHYLATPNWPLPRPAEKARKRRPAARIGSAGA